MNENRRKNISITAWLEKRSKPNVIDPVPIPVSSVNQVHSDEFSSSNLIHKNEHTITLLY